jgi:hypothetical protein
MLVIAAVELFESCFVRTGVVSQLPTQEFEIAISSD